MRTLIAGFGSIGRRHFRNLLALGEQDISFFRTGQSTLDVEELQGYRVDTDLTEALSRDPEAVVIANPTARHLEVALPAVRRGCHLLLEKPISNSMEGVDELRETARQTGSRILVGYQFRYHPNLLQIKELLENHAIGRILSLRSHWGEYLPGWHPWEDYRFSYAARKDLGGGVVLTLCHNLDYLGWLLGPIQIHSASLGYQSGLELEVEDSAEISLSLGKSILGSLHLNFYQRPARHTLDLLGSKGSISWDYYQGRVTLHQAGTEGKIQIRELACPPDFDRNQMFLDQMVHFRDVVKKDAEPACSLEDGIRALELSLRVLELGENHGN